jgi:hypothetical protein
MAAVISQRAFKIEILIKFKDSFNLFLVFFTYNMNNDIIFKEAAVYGKCI